MIEALNNYVIVDTGEKGKTTTQKDIGNGQIIHLVSVNTDEVDMMKVSGRVLSAPEKLFRTHNNKMKYQVKPVVKEGDTVFFEPTAQSYCEAQGLRLDDTVLAIPYHFLVAKTNGNDMEMLNGKVLVKNTDVSEETDGGVIIPEVARERRYNQVEVMSVGNDEFKGAYFVGGKLHEFGSDEINEGDVILVNKYSDFKIQGLVVDDEKLDYKKVNRESIVANLSNDAVAYGMYVQCEPLKKEEKTKAGIIIPDTRKLRPVYGKVKSVGSGNSGIEVGDYLKFQDREHPKYNGDIYIHNDLLICKVDGSKLTKFDLDKDILE